MRGLRGRFAIPLCRAGRITECNIYLPLESDMDTMERLNAMLDAIALLESRYNDMILDGTPTVVRQILHRIINRYNTEARQMLTGA